MKNFTKKHMEKLNKIKVIVLKLILAIPIYVPFIIWAILSIVSYFIGLVSKPFSYVTTKYLNVIKKIIK